MKLEEYLVLELTIRFKLTVSKGGSSYTLQASIGSSESLNVNILNPQSR